MIALILLGLLLGVHAKIVSVDVEGKFVCKPKSDAAVYVELKERDLFGDDVLAWANANTRTRFVLHGEENEIFDVEPYLVVKHDCAGDNEVLTINLGKLSGSQRFELGDINLAGPNWKEEMRNDTVQSTQEPL
ncbi:Transthyretin-like family protein [Ostertagia ostertagi]